MGCKSAETCPTATAARRRNAENENSKRVDGTRTIVCQEGAAEIIKIGLVNKSVLWCSYFAATVFLIQVLSPSVSGSPILLLPENMQGPVSVARNIRHLPCISRRTGEEGVCMFAIDCLKSNGSHLGTCIDRFYFGSCCQIPDHNGLEPVISNNIEDNTIDGSILNPAKVEPQSTTEKVIDKPESINDVLKPEPEHKTESNDEVKKVSTVLSIETTTVSKLMNAPSTNTEVPNKISTFQTVEDVWSSTEKYANISDSVSSTSSPPLLSTTLTIQAIGTSTPLRPKPTRVTTEPTLGTKKPQRPSQKPASKPTFRPTKPARPSSTTRLPNVTTSSSITLPISNTTLRPRPTKPVTFNITRKPVYKPPPKRPLTTKRPVNQPPRLNITLISQTTTLRPGVRPSVTYKPSPTTTHITYINTTAYTQEYKNTTSTPSSTAAILTSIKNTLTTSPTTLTATEINSELSSQKPVLSTKLPLLEENVPVSDPPVPVDTSKIPLSEKDQSEPEKSTIKVPLVTAPEKVATEKVTEPSISPTKEPPKSGTDKIVTEAEAQKLTTKVPENITVQPSSTEVPHIATDQPILSSTEYLTTLLPVEETKFTTQSSKNNVSSEKPYTSTELPEDTTVKNTVPAKNTEAPVSSAAPEVVGTSSSSPESSTPYPPGLVTWSTNVDTATKSPDADNGTSQENWSPIPPPDDWVLMPPVKPKPETTVSPLPTTASVPLDSSSTSPIPSTSTLAVTTPVLVTSPVPVRSPVPETSSVPVTSPVSATSSVSVPVTSNIPAASTSEIPLTSTSETAVDSASEMPVTSSSEMPIASTAEIIVTTTKITSSSSPPVTETTIPEFTVNVTLTPTVPSSTESAGLSTLSSISNVTEAATSAANVSEIVTNASESSSSTVAESSTAPSANVSSAETVTPVPHPEVNMSNYKDVCGRRLWPEARIVGGAKSGFGRWPWQISLRQWQTSTYLHKCGAALLNENWAITAAHCVERVPPSELLVRLGEHDLAHEAEPYGFAERRVQIVASHPHFDPATFEYDLALLRFYEPVTFQPNILPVCVPESDDNFVGKTAYVTGWGRLYDGGPLPKSLQEVALPVLNNSECEAMYQAAGQFQRIPGIFVCAGWKSGGYDGCDEGPLPSVLQEVSVPVINNTVCEAMYRAAGYNEHIPNIFICAGWKKGGSDSCEGDSGGPMVLQRADNRFVLGGVISWGIGCAEPNQPGVYTRISEFRDWINQILQF